MWGKEVDLVLEEDGEARNTHNFLCDLEDAVAGVLFDWKWSRVEDAERAYVTGILRGIQERLGEVE